MPKTNPALDRLPPQALAAEQGVLGCILLDGSGAAVAEVRELISEGDFYRKPNGVIFRAMVSLHDRGQPTDLITVREELFRVGMLDYCDGKAYLDACMGAASDYHRVAAYAEDVAETSRRRRTGEALLKAAGLTYSGDISLSSVIGEAQRFLADPALLNGHGKALGPRGRIYTASALQTMDLPPPRWAVPDLIPQGLTIFAGRMKMGKSWAAYQIALAVASGGKALSAIEVEQGDVLYLALEDTKLRLQERMHTLMGDEPWPERLELVNEWPRLPEGGAAEIIAWIKDHDKPRLIIIDVFAKARAVPVGKASVYDEDYQAIGEVKAVADSRNVAVLILHHLRKMRSDDPVEEVSGSAGLTGAADTILLLKRDRGKPEADIYVTGRDVEETSKKLLWDPRFAWRLVGDSDDFNRSREDIETLKAMWEFGGVASAAMVAEVLGIPRNTVKQRLYRMASRGLTRSDAGKFRIEAPGMAVLSAVTDVTSVTAVNDALPVTESAPDPFVEHEIGPN